VFLTFHAFAVLSLPDCDRKTREAANPPPGRWAPERTVSDNGCANREKYRSHPRCRLAADAKSAEYGFFLQKMRFFSKKSKKTA
jgi:hypothetical protein